MRTAHTFCNFQYCTARPGVFFFSRQVKKRGSVSDVVCKRNEVTISKHVKEHLF